MLFSDYDQSENVKEVAGISSECKTFLFKQIQEYVILIVFSLAVNLV